MRSEGCAILLTTHYIEEASLLCDRVGIIDHGKLVATGAPQELIAHSQARRKQASPPEAHAAKDLPWRTCSLNLPAAPCVIEHLISTMNGLLHHLALTLRLNFRDWRALALGYVVPVFFLLAFGSVFRSSVPPLANEMGQLLTITILGGACFGMPTTMVSERERGVWRRYRLLPTATAGLIVSTMVARYLIVLLRGRDADRPRLVHLSHPHAGAPRATSRRLHAGLFRVPRDGIDHRHAGRDRPGGAGARAGDLPADDHDRRHRRAAARAAAVGAAHRRLPARALRGGGAQCVPGGQPATACKTHVSPWSAFS